MSQPDSVTGPRPRRRLAAVALLLGCLLLAGSALSLASCRRGGVAEPPDGAGDLAPSIVTAGAGLEAAIALGPFANLRTMGWLTASEAYGWGDVTDARQIYVTLGVGGDTRSVAIPVADQLAVAFPLPGGAGCAGVHYSEFHGLGPPDDGQPQLPRPGRHHGPLAHRGAPSHLRPEGVDLL